MTSKITLALVLAASAFAFGSAADAAAAASPATQCNFGDMGECMGKMNEVDNYKWPKSERTGYFVPKSNWVLAKGADSSEEVKAYATNIKCSHASHGPSCAKAIANCASDTIHPQANKKL